MSVDRGNSLFDAIVRAQQPHHDTLYCSKEVERRLTTDIGLRNADNVQIHGLDVIAHPKFQAPIVCEKGDVFTITADFKDD